MTPRTVFRALLPVIVFLLLGCVPILSLFLWSAHGGVGWLLLPLCFPYVVIRLAILVVKAGAERGRALKMAAVAFAAYVFFAYPTTGFTERYVNRSIGPFLQAGTLFRLAVFPIGLAIPNHNPKP